MKLKKLFTLDECEEIITYAENEILSEWKEFREDDADGNLFLRYSIKGLNTHSLCTERFKEFVNNEFPFTVNKVNISILKYLKGYKFGRHFDRMPQLEANHDFIFNVNVVLNNNFTGGEFWLNDKLLNNTPGMVYYYNSTEWHEVKEITSGVRYSILCYVRERDCIMKNKKSII
jgi:predicted 2-oxoglutarate/Fe(II)-dependent dioxygenase YbiX